MNEAEAYIAFHQRYDAERAIRAARRVENALAFCKKEMIRYDARLWLENNAKSIEELDNYHKPDHTP